MEIINPYLKRDCDKSAKDSYLWLYEEAKKYNTVVSIHGNISDADFSKAEIYNITAEKNEYMGVTTVRDKKYHYVLSPVRQ